MNREKEAFGTESVFLDEKAAECLKDYFFFFNFIRLNQINNSDFRGILLCLPKGTHPLFLVLPLYHNILHDQFTEFLLLEVYFEKNC